MNKPKRKKTKNQKERNQYWKNARNQNHIDPTGPYGSENLQGSGDEPFPMDDTIAPNAAEVARMSPKTWWKRNKGTVLKDVVITLLVALISAAGEWVYNENAAIEVIKTRINKVEETIASLETDITTKEVLDLKLEIIKRDVVALIPDTSNITNRLDEIETRITTLENEDAAP